LKGGRCYTKKCAIDRRNFPPGQSAGGPQKKLTEYAIQLREKQKMKRYYRVLEKPFRNTLKEAERRRGVSGENLLALLELRLDNVVYRLNLSASRAQSRQLVAHGHFAVNGARVDIPSYIVKPGDSISVLEGSRKIVPILESLRGTGKRIPDWLSLDPASFSAKILAVPSREQIDAPVQEQLIVEFYSR
jgi:small subunit ribosomal protein S4